MKIFALIAAGLLGFAATTPVAAVAAPITVAPAAVEPVQERVIVRQRTSTRYDNRRGVRGVRGNRWGSRQVCRTERRGPRRARICRTVRYRR